MSRPPVSTRPSGPRRVLVPLSALLALVALLATLLVAGLGAPASADAGGVPNSPDTAGSPPADPGPPADKRPPLPDQAQVPDHAPGQGLPGAADQDGPGQGPDGPRPPADPGPPADAGPPSHAGPPPADGPDPVVGLPPGQGGLAPQKDPHRVVVCKYVRKPGAAEIYSHPVIVDHHALLGKGFSGTFPFPFSDGQLQSVAIRWAEKGERARDVADSECTAPGVVPPEVPPGGGENPPAGQVLGVTEEANPADARAAAVTAPREAALPQTGASDSLVLLSAVGGLMLLAGVGLATAAVRRRPVA
ncbi:LPXTG cell wall anchor domain-containing protein [Nocardioides sp. R1-1]|uniref:LPXTG cell wall anchor domain-containing protein n=1 Tax=Nocardioides sp. R1-1 TaxID=3383502 RepID=UPI0038D16453